MMILTLEHVSNILTQCYLATRSKGNKQNLRQVLLYTRIFVPRTTFDQHNFGVMKHTRTVIHVMLGHCA